MNLTLKDGAPVSKLCFGAMQFGGTADHRASQEMYEACRARGINFFDTAYSYTDGTSETWLGAFIRPERDAVYVATKAANGGRATREALRSQLSESLQRLGIDGVDALYLHRWDAETPLEETFGTVAEFRAEGKIRHVGVSNYAAWQVMKAIRVAAEFELTISLIQPMYSLVKRQVEVEILPMAMDQGIAVVPYSPLGGGLLTGKYRGAATGRITDDPRYAARYREAWMHEAAAHLAELADEVGVAAPTLAVAWVAAQPAVFAPIISARSRAQLEPALAALDFEMDVDVMARMTALSPTPAPATDRLEERA